MMCCGMKMYDNPDNYHCAICGKRVYKKKVPKICPICNKKYLGFPAISRKDNVTKICPKCGADEASAEFIQYATAKMRKANH